MQVWGVRGNLFRDFCRRITSARYSGGVMPHSSDILLGIIRFADLRTESVIDSHSVHFVVRLRQLRLLYGRILSSLCVLPLFHIKWPNLCTTQQAKFVPKKHSSSKFPFTNQKIFRIARLLKREIANFRSSRHDIA